ncbi:hypothetical protein BDV3_005906 [Batrachochytrium dendrobatidis]
MTASASQLNRINPAFIYPNYIYEIALATVCWGTLHRLLLVFVFKPATSYLFPVKNEDLAIYEKARKAGKNPSSKSEHDTVDTMALRRKFMSAAWKFVFFSTSFCLGAHALSQDTWWRSPEDYFLGWPNHPMNADLKVYYVTGIGCSLYTFVMLFIDRMSFKDTMVMILHHCATLFLLLMSYIYGCHRAGAVVLTLHDASDPIMELAKMSLYTGRKKWADVLFVLYATTFISTRLIVYPLYVASSVRKYAYWTDGSEVPTYFLHYAFEYLLWTLQFLHIYWGYLIFNMLVQAIFNKGVSDDVRNKTD